MPIASLSCSLARALGLGALAITGLLSGCATPPPASDPDAVAEYQENNDPLEPTNRVFYAINNGLDTVILRPIAVAYRYAIPEVIRTHTHNFLVNLANPVTLADDMLQGKPRRAGDTLMRTLINTTVGVAGVFDVATDLGYPAHDTDFGVTLAVWGLPDGPFLFLPLYGPSNPRDGIGIAADTILDPLTWAPLGYIADDARYGRFAVSAVDARSQHIDDIDQIKASALDPYATFRSLYRQHRNAQIQETKDDNRATIPAWFPNRAEPTPPSAPTPPPGEGLQGAPTLQ